MLQGSCWPGCQRPLQGSFMEASRRVSGLGSGAGPSHADTGNASLSAAPGIAVLVLMALGCRGVLSAWEVSPGSSGEASGTASAQGHFLL